MHILVTSWYEHSSIFQRVLFDSKGWCIGTPYHPFSTLWKIQVEISNSVSEILRFPGGLTQLLMIHHVTKMSMVFLEKNTCYLIWPNQIIVFHQPIYGCFQNKGTPNHPILIGFSLINHPFWDTSIFGNTHIFPWEKRISLPQLTFSGPSSCEVSIILAKFHGRLGPAALWLWSNPVNKPSKYPTKKSLRSVDCTSRH